MPDQRTRYQRRARAPLGGDKGRKEGEADKESDRRCHNGEANPRKLTEAINEQARAAGPGQGAPGIEPASGMHGDVSNCQWGQPQAEPRNRRREHEDCPPSQETGQYTAKQDARHPAEWTCRSPRGQRAMARRSLWKRSDQERERGRSEQRRASALDRAGHDEPGCTRREPRRQRARGKQRQPDRKEATMPKQVRGPPARQQQPAKRKGIRADEPLGGRRG